MKELISQGAEAKIFLEENRISKYRLLKQYRNPIIDNQIRTRRTRQEAKILYKAKELGINVPTVFNFNKKNIPNDEFIIEMEYISGDKLSEKLNSYEEKKQLEIMKKIAKQVLKLHQNGIIHSDLTTSNIILKNDEIYIIDFGLGFFSLKIEDKAVDLHLIKQALEAKHYMNYEKLFESFIKEYNQDDMTKKIIEQLKKVELRGRYKGQY